MLFSYRPTEEGSILFGDYLFGFEGITFTPLLGAESEAGEDVLGAGDLWKLSSILICFDLSDADVVETAPPHIFGSVSPAL